MGKILIVILIFSLAPTIVVAKEDEIKLILFSNEAKFMEIEVSSSGHKIVDVGNLWWRGIFIVNFARQHRSSHNIFINTSKAILRPEFTDWFRGVIVLSRGPKREFSIEKILKLIPSVKSKSFLDAPIGADILSIQFGEKNNTIGVQWMDGNKTILTLYKANDLSKFMEIDWREQWGSGCLDLDNSLVYKIENGKILSFPLDGDVPSEILKDLSREIISNKFQIHWENNCNFQVIYTDFLGENVKHAKTRIIGFDIKEGKVVFDIRKKGLFKSTWLQSEETVLLSEYEMRENIVGNNVAVGMKRQYFENTILLNLNTNDEKILHGLVNTGYRPTFIGVNRYIVMQSERRLGVFDIDTGGMVVDLDVPFFHFFVVLTK